MIFGGNTCCVAHGATSAATSRAALGRKMTEAESGLGLFWTDSFSAKEVIFFTDASLAEKRNELLAGLKDA